MNEQINQQQPGAESQVDGEILVRRRHRRHHREESRIQRIWRRRHWEIIGGLALVIGIFLAFGPLARWITPGPPGEPVDIIGFYISKIATAITKRLDAAASAVWTFLLLANWAIKLGYVLLALAVVLIPLRARTWLLYESPWLRMRCPVCGSANIHRVHRRAWERVVGKIIPLRRYRCSDCRWRGIRIDTHGRAPVQTVLQSRR